MIHYKHPDGTVFAYETKSDRDAFGHPDLVEMRKADEESYFSQVGKPKTNEEVERLRLLAYADPVTGCDRYQSEANAERLRGNEDAALAAEEKLLVRREEIKAENPWLEA